MLVNPSTKLSEQTKFVTCIFFPLRCASLLGCTNAIIRILMCTGFEQSTPRIQEPCCVDRIVEFKRKAKGVIFFNFSEIGGPFFCDINVEIQTGRSDVSVDASRIPVVRVSIFTSTNLGNAPEGIATLT
jgi:hypothetical protein